MADRQTAGRGRTRNVWWSPPGCLMLSLAIGEDDLPGDISTRPLLSLVVGVALLRAAERLTGLASLELKWPNDLYISGKKGAGILIETISDQLSPVGPVWIIGIGLNVEVPWHEAPPDVATKGICLSLASGRAINVESALVELIESLRSELEGWRSGSWDWLHLWNERSLLSDKIVQLRLPTGEMLVGRCEGIDLHGRLLLRDQLQTHAVGAAEVVSWDSV
ncbi:MAG: biotin--[acetyl-CoA-carboxylase] ligase [Pirellulales bacterium]